MASIDWKAWLAAANPLRPPSDAAGLTRGARLSSVALVLSAAWGLFSLVEMALDPAGYAQIMSAAAAGRDAEVAPEFFAAMFTAMMPLLLVATAAFLIAWLALAWVQWRQLTRVIPALMFLLSAWGVIAALTALIGGHAPLGAWRMGVSAGVDLVGLVLHAAAFRAAARLQSLAGPSGT